MESFSVGIHEQFRWTFKVNIYNADGSYSSTIATSGISSDINGTSVNPDLYRMTATIPETVLTTDKRLGIEIFWLPIIALLGVM
jgi:hypothetical protein